MSGGHWDYYQYKLEDIACELQKENCPASWRAFGKHLELVAKTIGCIDWYLSGDSGDEYIDEMIAEVLGETHKEQIAVCLQEEVRNLIKELEKYGNLAINKD